MFWWLDLPAPLLWGLVMGVLAIVPVRGAFVVWIPAAAFLALDGSWGKALILAAACSSAGSTTSIISFWLGTDCDSTPSPLSWPSSAA